MKLCINCRHHELYEARVTAQDKQRFPALYKEEVGHLLRSEHLCNQRIHPVLGVVTQIECYTSRTTADPVLGLACGPEGRFYEENEGKNS